MPNPLLDAAVESHVSKSARRGAPSNRGARGPGSSLVWAVSSLAGVNSAIMCVTLLACIALCSVRRAFSASR